jgi:peptidoglycan/xylan/chitin deacetylase (PgdA/CDA1 family)
MTLREAYYMVKPLTPRWAQIVLRRWIMSRKRERCRDVWPILQRAGNTPAGWKGWPDGKRFCVVLTHDVETARGQDRCRAVAELEMSLGFRSSFNFVPERYAVSPSLRAWLTENGFEVGVHGLNHDGKYFSSPEVFRERAKKINRYMKEWKTQGFRTPSMLHDLDAIHQLDITYDASTFDTDPFEPQSDGVETIFPFVVPPPGGGRGYVELPYTLPQDFCVFVMFQERDTRLWEEKTRWIAERGGMSLLITHPDYMAFQKGKPAIDEYAPSLYGDYLRFLRDRFMGEYWHALPGEVAHFIHQAPGCAAPEKTREHK